MTLNSQQSVLLVEDDVNLSRMIASALKEQGYLVDVASNGLQGMKAIQEQHPDVLLLDMMLPHCNGLELLSRITPDYQGIVLMMTGSSQDNLEEMAFETGVHDFIQKPIRPHILFAKLKALTRLAYGANEEASDSKRYRVQDLCLDVSARRLYLDNQPLNLTDAEYAIAEYFMSKPGYILHRADLVSVLRGIEYDGLDRAIDMRISALRKKMNDTSPPYKYIKTIRGQGYMLSES